jgi:hypothetical protein
MIVETAVLPPRVVTSRWESMRRKSQQRNQLNPEEKMRQTACDLVRVAINALMNMGVDRETAGQWIVNAVRIVVAEDHD